MCRLISAGEQNVDWNETMALGNHTRAEWTDGMHTRDMELTGAYMTRKLGRLGCHWCCMSSRAEGEGPQFHLLIQLSGNLVWTYIAVLALKLELGPANANEMFTKICFRFQFTHVRIWAFPKTTFRRIYCCCVVGAIPIASWNSNRCTPPLKFIVKKKSWNMQNCNEHNTLPWVVIWTRWSDAWFIHFLYDCLTTRSFVQPICSIE